MPIISLQKNLMGTDAIRFIIPILSGKGGVGKSTVAASLAVDLAYKGYKVMPKDFCVDSFYVW